MRKTTLTPKNKLRRATGMPDQTLKFGTLRKETLLGMMGFLTFLGKRAVSNPGVTQHEYFEENGYEYELHATYNEADNTIVTNDIRCPAVSNHHLGQTCIVCGQED